MEIERSNRKDKKYVAVFKDGTKIHFGATGYEDYTTHGDEKRKELYLARHKKREDWNDPKTAGSLSRWILWEYKSFDKAVREFKKKFSV